MRVSIRDAKRIMKALAVQGVPCGRHHAGFFVVDGVRILKLHHSPGSGTMSPAVAELFRKSLKLSVQEFDDLIASRLSREAYVQILRERGWITDLGAPAP